MSQKNENLERWSVYELILKDDEEAGTIEVGVLTSDGIGPGPFSCARRGDDLALTSQDKTVLLENPDPSCLKALEQGVGLFIIDLAKDDVQPVKTPW